jgi:hypothetical protein
MNCSLADLFDKADAEARQAAEKEIERSGNLPETKTKDKWKLRVSNRHKHKPFCVTSRPFVQEPVVMQSWVEPRRKALTARREPFLRCARCSVRFACQVVMCPHEPGNP